MIADGGQFGWLTSEAATTLIAALGSANIRFVGGAVRDSLMGRPVKDLDAATSLPPQEVIEKLTAAGIKTVPTGLAHGTVTAVFDKCTIEVTTLRHDVETFGRHARVAYHDNWGEDAARRDFTINALYVSSDGAVHDYFGGREDLRAGRVRFIGDARDRIREDALRILRFFRFHAHYGRGDPDAVGLAACEELKGMIRNLSVERFRDEFLKLLSAEDPVAILRIMADRNMLTETPLGRPDLQSLERLVKVERLAGTNVPLRRLFALSAGLGNITTLAKTLRFSNEQIARLKAMDDPSRDIVSDMGAQALRAATYRLGRQAVIDRLYLGATPDTLSELLADRECVRSFPMPELPVTGQDLKAAGFTEGPDLGKAKKALEDKWIESDFTLGRDALLKFLTTD